MNRLAGNQSVQQGPAEEINKIGGLTIAELRSRFQHKDSDVTPGSVKFQASASPVTGVTTEKETASSSLSSNEVTRFKETLQKFGQFSPQRPPPGKLSASGLSSGESSAQTVRTSHCHADVSTGDSPRDTSSSNEVIEKGKAEHPGKPVKRLQNNPGSHYKLPKPIPPPRIVTERNGILGVVQNSQSETGSKQLSDTVVVDDGIKPNTSHLSALISEIQFQQHRFNKSPAVSSKESAEDVKLLTESCAVGSLPSLPGRCLSAPSTLKSDYRQHSSSLTSLKGHWKLKQLPSLDVLGGPPRKPGKPPPMRSSPVMAKDDGTPPLPRRNPPIGTNVLPSLLQAWPKVAHPAPASVLKDSFEQHSSLAKDEKQGSTRSSSPIPEFTEEEELGSASELYDDTADSSHILHNTSLPSPLHSPALMSEELYHDAVTFESESCNELYEDVGISENTQSESGMAVFGTKDCDQKKEDDRKLRRQQKENERRLRDLEKQRKKFNLTGNEAPMDTGMVKETIKGRWKDNLTVKKGETITILRVSNNPIGKWLIQNEEGKVGYMDITNIEVDANSIRYIMSQLKPAECNSDDWYDDNALECEAIYEEFA